jgi:hypothetical protein
MPGIVDQAQRVPCPVAARGHAQQAGGHVAAERRRDRGRVGRIDVPQARQQPQRRRRIGRAAADPDATGKRLSRSARAAVDIGGLRAQAPRGPQTRLSSVGEPSPNGPMISSDKLVGGSALSRSPSVQKANIVSIAWRPSGSLPRTCSARLSLAGAGSRCASRRGVGRGQAGAILAFTRAFDPRPRR